MGILTDWYFEFEEEGVWVTVPTQELADASFSVRLEKEVSLADAMWAPGGFQPLRIIGNLKAVGEPEGGFSPGVQVRVRYTCMDLYRAMERYSREARAPTPGELLALAYWDGEHGAWVRFDKTQHGYRLEPPDPIGYAYLELTHIGDPAISWGT